MTRPDFGWYYPPGCSGPPDDGPWYCVRCGEKRPEHEEPDDEGRCEDCAEKAAAEAAEESSPDDSDLGGEADVSGVGCVN